MGMRRSMGRSVQLLERESTANLEQAHMFNRKWQCPNFGFRFKSKVVVKNGG